MRRPLSLVSGDRPASSSKAHLAPWRRPSRESSLEWEKSSVLREEEEEDEEEEEEEKDEEEEDEEDDCS